MRIIRQDIARVGAARSPPPPVAVKLTPVPAPKAEDKGSSSSSPVGFKVCRSNIRNIPWVCQSLAMVLLCYIKCPTLMSAGSATWPPR